MNFETVFANPFGRISRGRFTAALVVLLLVAAFYFTQVKGRNGEWVLVTLMYPALMLHARRLHDMGQTAWLLLVPAALTAAAVWLYMSGSGSQLGLPASWAALAACAAFALWGLAGKGQPEANRFGEPAAA